MIIDSKDVELFVSTSDNLKILREVAQKVVNRLVDEGYEVRIDSSDCWSCPRVEAIKTEVL